jgi:hypothetical protein
VLQEVPAHDVCNDDNGPACATSRASASFPATSGTTYFILAGGSGGASGNLNIVASGPSGLRIISTFGPSITGDPQGATIQATINAAIAFYQANFSDPITVTITFQEMGSGLGLSSTYVAGGRLIYIVSVVMRSANRLCFRLAIPTGLAL